MASPLWSGGGGASPMVVGRSNVSLPASSIEAPFLKGLYRPTFTKLLSILPCICCCSTPLMIFVRMLDPFDSVCEKLFPEIPETNASMESYFMDVFDTPIFKTMQFISICVVRGMPSLCLPCFF